MLRRGCSLGSVATGAFGTVPGLLLLPYLTDTLGIVPLLAGVVVFVPKAWDVVLNPISGRASDRFAARRLARRPFLLAAGVRDAVAAVVVGVERTDHVAIVGRLDAALVTMSADDACDVFTICDKLAECGWYVRPRLSFRGMPPTMHLSLSTATARHVDEFLAALSDAVLAAVASGPVRVDEQLRGRTGRRSRTA